MVIIGDDLRYENGKLIVDINKRAKTDQGLSKVSKKLLKENPEEHNILLMRCEKYLSNINDTRPKRAVIFTVQIKKCYLTILN